MKKILSKTVKFIKYTIMLPLYWLSCIVPKDKNTWVFGAWFGERYADNSKYLFEYVNKNYPKINTIWLTKNKIVYNDLKTKGYKVVLKKSLKGIYFSMRAKVFIVCQSKKEDIYPFVNDKVSVVVQLWHGIPLKKIGYDDKIYSFCNARSQKNKIKKLFFPFLIESYSLLIATSEETRKIFSQAFKIEKDKVKITGYPRNDRLFTVSKEEEYIKIIYLPTFRKGRGFEVDLFSTYGFNVIEINKKLKNNNAKLYIKLHPVNKPPAHIIEQIHNSTQVEFVESSEDLYENLSTFDILITDYSSVFFDYLLLDKPIIFAPFDIEAYLKHDREFYYNYEDVTPGPKARNWNQVLIHIEEAIKYPNKYKKERKEIRDLFHKYQDGNSSMRVFNEIIKLLS